jgi:uncharacterized repeat protein (TIGR02543 family)
MLKRFRLRPGAGTKLSIDIIRSLRRSPTRIGTSTMRAHRRIATAIVAAAVVATGLLLTAPATPAWAAGNFALRFNGDTAPDANVVTTTTSPVLTSNFTVSADLRWDGTNGYRAAVSMPNIDNAFSSSTGLALGLNDGAPFFALKDTTLTGRVVVAATPLAVGQWFTVTGTYDGQVTNIYVDGALVATQDFGSALDLTTTTGSILIGREFAKSLDPSLNSRGFHGDVDKLVISSGLYPAALTTIASYAFSEGSGLSTADSGPSSYTGTLSAGSTPEWVQGSAAIALTYKSPGATSKTTHVRPYTPIVYRSATTFTRPGYTFAGWQNVSTLVVVSPGDAGVKALTPETYQALWTADALAATGTDDAALWWSVALAVGLLGVGCGLVVVGRRRAAVA